MEVSIEKPQPRLEFKQDDCSDKSPEIQKVQEVAQPALSSFRLCLDKVIAFGRKVWEISGKFITSLFCLIIGTSWVNPEESLIDEKKVHSLVQYNLSEKKIDSIIFRQVVDDAFRQADLIYNTLSSMKADELKDLKKIKSLEYEITENLKQLRELLYFDKNQTQEKKIFNRSQKASLDELTVWFEIILSEFYKKINLEHKNLYESFQKKRVEESSKPGFFHIFMNLLKETPEVPVVDPTLKPAYFYNVQNRCWMHASLQVLLALEGFIDIGINKNPTGHMANAFKKLISAIHSGLFSQTDIASHQFHKALIDANWKRCHPDLLVNPNQQKDAPCLFESVLPDLKYKITLEKTLSGIDEQAHLTSIITEDSDLIKIQFTNKETFQETIDDYFSKHLIDDDQNMWQRENVTIPKRTEQYQIKTNGENPDYLFIQLVRYSKSSDLTLLQQEREALVKKKTEKLLKKETMKQKTWASLIAETLIPQIDATVKINDPLLFNINENDNFIIDFSKAFNETKEKSQYELRGIVYHQGGFQSGHYTANVLKSVEGGKQWYHCDDLGRRVIPISPEAVHPENGYIFAFKKMDKDPFAY